MGTGTNKETDQPWLWHEKLMKVRVFLEQEIQSNIHCDQADSLQQNFANKMIYFHMNVSIQFGGTG